VRLAFLAVSLVALTGCAAQPSSVTSEPSVTAVAPSEQPTVSPTPAAVPSALQLNLASIEVVDSSGAVLESVAFGRPVSEVVELVEHALGQAPAVDHRDEHPCTAATDVTFYRWYDHAIQITYEGDPGETATWRQPGAYYVKFAANAVDSIELRGANGLRVGDDGAAFLAAVADGDIEQVGESAVVGISDVGGSWARPGFEGSWGLAGLVDGGVITAWVSPSDYLDFFC
jgi:hypothetical protein